MAFDFPATPALGQVFGNYIWDGEKWKLQGGQAIGAVRYDMPQILSAGQQTQARHNIAAPGLDALAYSGLQINGNCCVSQERTPGTAVIATGYICDGWQQYIGGPVVSSLLYGAGNSEYIIETSVTTAKPSLAASDLVLIHQNIEGYRTARLAWGGANAQPLTIGFWSSHNRPGVYCVSARNNAVTRSYVATYTQAVADVFQYNVVTIPGDTTGTWEAGINCSISITFCMAAGTTFQAASANTWSAGNFVAVAAQVNGVATTSDKHRIFRVVVLPGIEAPTAAQSPLIMRPYGEELLTCQRYWRKTSDLSGIAFSTTSLRMFTRHAPVMRAAPTGLTPGSTAVTIMDVYATNPAQSSLSMGVNVSNTDMSIWDFANFTGLTVGRLYYLSTNTPITLDARL